MEGISRSVKNLHLLYLLFLLPFSFGTPQNVQPNQRADVVLYNHHGISPYARDNVEICKSRPFAPTQLNYRRSGTDDWLKQYTLENKDRNYFRKHGLASTIAYDFLGDTNFKCAIGIQSSCSIQCLNVVGHIEDLELARRVYFVLASAGHFTASIEIIHNSIQAAQNNVGLMAGRMSYTFYWTQPSADELQRAAGLNQLTEICLWAAQSALNSVMPLIPWSSMKDWVLAKMSENAGHPIAKDQALINLFPSPTDDQIPETQLMQYKVNNQYLPDAPYTLRVPPRFGGRLQWNPDGVSLANWWYNNGKLDGRLNKQEFYGQWENNQMMRYNEKQPGEEDDMTYRHGWFPDFRARWNIHGFAEAASHAWDDFKDLCSGTMYGWRRFVHGVWSSAESDRIQDEHFDGYGQVDGHTVTRKIWSEGMDEKRDWMARIAAGEDIPEDERRQQPVGKLHKDNISYITYLRTKAKLDPPTKLGDDMKLASWGPTTERQALGRYEGWDSYDQYHLEQIAKTWPFSDKPEKVWMEGASDPSKLPEITSMVYQATERVADVARVIFPMVAQGAVRSLVLSFFSKWSGDDRPREWNEMGLQWFIQESSRISRIALKETVNRVMRSEDVKEDGSTEFADLLALGSYLPATDGVLGAWTAADVENTLTKNIFYKTLNVVMNSQKIYISCTSDFNRMKPQRPLMLPEMEPVKTCAEDDTGPQHSKACIGDIGVCYMYRWNDRGIILSHVVEDPFGSDELAGDPWNLQASDVITSSFWSHIMGLRDTELASKLSILNDGPTTEQAADPRTPGLFTLPICLSKYNWNTETTKGSFVEDIDAYSRRKALPCYCGDLGKDTVSVWESMGITGTIATRDYMKRVCPIQITMKIGDWLERYIAYCQLGVRRTSTMKTIKLGKDGMCDIVIAELESHNISSALDLEPEHRIALKCKIKGDKRKKCKAYVNSPISSVWAETLGAVQERKEKELKGGREVSIEGEEYYKQFEVEEIRGDLEGLGEGEDIGGVEHE